MGEILELNFISVGCASGDKLDTGLSMRNGRISGMVSVADTGSLSNARFVVASLINILSRQAATCSMLGRPSGDLCSMVAISALTSFGMSAAS